MIHSKELEELRDLQRITNDNLLMTPSKDVKRWRKITRAGLRVVLRLCPFCFFFLIGTSCVVLSSYRWNMETKARGPFIKLEIEALGSKSSIRILGQAGSS